MLNVASFPGSPLALTKNFIGARGEPGNEAMLNVLRQETAQMLRHSVDLHIDRHYVITTNTGLQLFSIPCIGRKAKPSLLCFPAVATTVMV